jgi:UDP:flavonoid glycosyltransferase YjiC (YdhE family)
LLKASLLISVYSARSERAFCEELTYRPAVPMVSRYAHAGAQLRPQQPSHMRVERHIPQQLLLPACDLVVAHGGFGTVVGALSHALPLVLVPMGADQFYKAECSVRLGVGQVVPLGEQPSDTIRLAVRAALENDEFRTRAQCVRDEMAVMPGPEHAVELLEQLASLKEPLLA